MKRRSFFIVFDFVCTNNYAAKVMQGLILLKKMVQNGNQMGWIGKSVKKSRRLKQGSDARQPGVCHYAASTVIFCK
jgi:hypothetical protein